MATFQILSVCTANICRSPAAERFLEHDVSDEIERGLIGVGSYGTQAMPGRAACDLSTTLVRAFLPSPYQAIDPPLPRNRTHLNARASETDLGLGTSYTSTAAASCLLVDTRPALVSVPPPGFEHSSRRVTEDALQLADLILALDREHRSTLARISPNSRSRTFTLRQAAMLSSHVRNTISSGELPHGAAPLPPPSETKARLSWLVAEMDAARGVCAQVAEHDSPGLWHPLDIPDPHVLGYQIHSAVIEMIRTETREISSTIQAVLQK